VFLIIIAVCALVLWRKRRKQNNDSVLTAEASRVPSPDLPLQPPSMALKPDLEPRQLPPAPRAFPRSSQATYYSNLTSAPSYTTHSRDNSITSATRILPSSSSQVSSGRAPVSVNQYVPSGTSRRGVSILMITPVGSCHAD
jgi:hypothetical protein